jgi:hypothetical protein
VNIKQIIKTLEDFDNGKHKYFLKIAPSLELFSEKTLRSITCEISIIIQPYWPSGSQHLHNLYFQVVRNDGCELDVMPYKSKELALQRVQDIIDLDPDYGGKNFLWNNREFIELHNLKLPDKYLKQRRIEKLRN